MPDIIAAISPRQKKNGGVKDIDCIIQVRAELVSLGGSILLALCLFLTAGFVVAVYSPGVTPVQQFIAIILFASIWAYFLDSVSERIYLVDETITFKAALSRTRKIPISELEGMFLIHHGYTLEKGIGAIEFRQRQQKTDHVSLGPCWNWSKLEDFVGSVEKAMQV